jgi:hypothetical protein
MGVARTAAAVATLHALGIHKAEEVEKGQAFLDKTKPVHGGRPDMHYYYGHYYAAKVMHGRGGKVLKDWYTATAKELLEKQQVNGGWTDQIDSHYATAMACLVLLTPEGRLAVRSQPKKDKG